MSENLAKGDIAYLDYEIWVSQPDGSFRLHDTTRDEVAKKENVHDEKKVYGPVPVIIGSERLMKGFDDRGLVFYTGLDSQKSVEIKANPRAAATFVWTPLHRQVRFEGSVTAVESELADAYFSTRPRGAQIAAHASRQSTTIASREELDQRYDALDAEFGDGVVPRPETWGGWRLAAATVEFWQGQPNRFHDRIRYSKVGSDWVKQRLAP